MKVLVIGNGGREHALAYRASLSELVQIVYVAPGNAGTAIENKVENVPISSDDIDSLIAFAKQKQIDLTIVGPEAPLVAGIVDKFKEHNLKIFGPCAYAAQLEGSKAFSKDFLQKYNIPTAKYKVFTNSNEAIAYVKEQGAPIVIKADGLAAGKGVVVATTEQEAIDAINNMLLDNAFGKAGSRVVIEEFMQGEEASFIVMSDGINALAMASSQDHKRVGDNDTGPNTGGMGAYSPAPVVTNEVHQKVMDKIIMPTLKGMANEGYPYVGFLYAGLMIDKDGEPRVVEFNCRFGDPETQPIMLRMQSDLVDLCNKACSIGGLSGQEVKYDPKVAIGVVLAAKGYPQDVQKGDEISIENFNDPNVKLFYAGCKAQDGKLVTSSGRVFCLCALDNTLSEAKDRAYKAIDKVKFNGMFYRHDIGHRAL